MRWTEWEEKAFDYVDYSKSRILESAGYYAGELFEYFQHNSFTREDAYKKIGSVVYYLAKVDGFLDGDREVWTRIFGSDSSIYDGMDMLRECGGEHAIEEWVDYMPSSDKKNFLELACYIFAANGAIYDEEKAVLRRFG